MKSRLFVLLTALFMVGNVFAGTPLEDDLVLMGEFSQAGTRSVKPELPISATFEGNVLYVEFTTPVGNVDIAIKDATQNVVYTSSMDVTAFGQLCHFHGHTVTDFNGNCRCCQQAFVQHSMLFLGFLFLFAVPYQRICQLFQQLGERQQHCCSDNVEDRVYQSHASRINCRADKGEVQQPVQSVEYRKNN